MQESCLEEVETGERILFGGELLVGRHPANDLVLPFPQVSGYHAALVVKEGAWRIQDLGSTNGTTVNGRRLQRWRGVEVGTLLRFGGVSSWRVEVLADPSGVAVGGARLTLDQDRVPELELELEWTGPECGAVRVRHGGVQWTEPAGQAFELLVLLARRPREWVDDRELKEWFWGGGADAKSRTVFSSLIYNTRAIFKKHGISGRLVEKEAAHRGCTRLNLPPERVRIIGE